MDSDIKLSPKILQAAVISQELSEQVEATEKCLQEYGISLPIKSEISKKQHRAQEITHL